VTDIRVTARAETEEEAQHMVGDVRTEIISRLGNHYFGDDSTTLESVVNDQLAKMDWRAFLFLHGFDDNLDHRVESFMPRHIYAFNTNDDNPSSPELEIARNSGYQITIRADLFKVENKTNLAFTITNPDGEESVLRSHGGHPRLAQQWAENILLDFIRRYLYNKNNNR
jgi:nicotinamide-nucleotide amidase